MPTWSPYELMEEERQCEWERKMGREDGYIMGINGGESTPGNIGRFPGLRRSGYYNQGCSEGFTEGSAERILKEQEDRVIEAKRELDKEQDRELELCLNPRRERWEEWS